MSEHKNDHICTSAAGELNRLCKRFERADIAQRNELQDALFEARQHLQEVLLECHGGDDDAAMDDNRFDALFSHATELLDPKPQQGSKRFSVSKTIRKGSDGGYVANQYLK
ncbi:MAG: hypothetical protein KC680_00035 [Candidatus Peregrinibacteria bacterium]|nr:hypothetical protein [Candidatus Peregrinibacteria bacterium]MCB9808101.1 hypothetical protein [Candidatus Peribacteria bacterium]